MYNGSVSLLIIIEENHDDSLHAFRSVHAWHDVILLLSIQSKSGSMSSSLFSEVIHFPPLPFGFQSNLSMMTISWPTGNNITLEVVVSLQNGLIGRVSIFRIQLIHACVFFV